MRGLAMNHPRRPRIRLGLLVLLWVWAGLVFLVVDLFLDAPGLDRVRPRAEFYRAARLAAHEMVGEPYREAGDGARPVATATAARGAAMHRQEEPDPARLVEEIRSLSCAAGAETLLEMRHDVPPALLGAYAEAAAAALADVLAVTPPCPADEALAGRRADLAAAALEAQAQALRMPSPDWRSAKITIERLAFVPGYEERFADALLAMRQAVLRGLDPRAQPESLAEAAQLASQCGDASVAAQCLRLLPREPRSPRTREEAIVQEHAALAVARWGNEQDRVAVAVWLERALASEQDPARRRALSRQIEEAGTPRLP